MSSHLHTSFTARPTPAAGWGLAALLALGCAPALAQVGTGGKNAVGTGSKNEIGTGTKSGISTGSKDKVGTGRKAASPPPRPAAAASRTAAQTYRTALKAGRAASARKDYAEAIAHLQVARKLAPKNATVLGELGWAQFNAGILADAGWTTELALYATRTPKVLGMLYYNLGRVREAEGKPAEAWDAYRRSLAVRPNETVSKRLADLKTPTFPAVAGPEAFCKVLESTWDCGEERQCKCSITQVIESEAATTDGAPCTPAEGNTEFNKAVILRAALVRLEGESNGSLDTTSLAVQTGSGGWQLVGTVAENWSPGVGYIHNNGEVKRFEFGPEVSTCEGHTLVLVAERNDNDGDYGANTVDVVSETTVVLCNTTRPSGLSACHTVTVAREVGTAVMIEGEPHEGKVGTVKWARDWNLALGKFSTSPQPGTPAVSEDAPIELQLLGQRPGVVVTPLR